MCNLYLLLAAQRLSKAQTGMLYIPVSAAHVSTPWRSRSIEIIWKASRSKHMDSSHMKEDEGTDEGRSIWLAGHRFTCLPRVHPVLLGAMVLLTERYPTASNKPYDLQWFRRITRSSMQYQNTKSRFACLIIFPFYCNHYTKSNWRSGSLTDTHPYFILTQIASFWTSLDSSPWLVPAWGFTKGYIMRWKPRGPYPPSF